MIGGGLTAETLREDWQVDAPTNLTLPGPASHAGVQDAIAACSVLVVTSKREGLPTLVMEGMAHQKPVVVPDEAGCMEAIGDGEFGYIYQQGNIDDLVAKVELAVKDSSIGLRARQRVLEEYDWRVVAPRLDAIYQGGTPS
jgi:glycosyltransferase involved in cell wall biosynthesis